MYLYAFICIGIYMYMYIIGRAIVFHREIKALEGLEEGLAHFRRPLRLHSEPQDMKKNNLKEKT